MIDHLFTLGLTQNTHSRANQEGLGRRMPLYPVSLFLTCVTELNSSCPVCCHFPFPHEGE